jgi:cytochrome P450
LKQGKPFNADDFLDIYVNDYLSKENQTRKDGITREEMIQQSITLFGAGTDTTANLLANAVYYLGIDQVA